MANEISYTDNEIQRILKLYKQQREKNREKYEKIKDTEEFKLKNRARAKEHYHNNKHLKQNAYQNDKEFIKCRNSYNYYKKQDRVEEFKNKYPEKYMMLIDRKYLKSEGELC